MQLINRMTQGNVAQPALSEPHLRPAWAHNKTAAGVLDMTLLFLNRWRHKGLCIAELISATKVEIPL